MKTFATRYKTKTIPHYEDGCDHYVAATAKYQPEMGGWYTTYELVLNPVTRTQLFEGYEPNSVDIEKKCIWLAERGFNANNSQKIPVVNLNFKDSEEADVYAMWIGFLMADDRMSPAHLHNVQMLLTNLKLQKILAEKTNG